MCCHVHVCVTPPKRVWSKESGYQNVYKSCWEIELLGLFGNARNITLDFQVGNGRNILKVLQLHTLGITLHYFL